MCILPLGLLSCAIAAEPIDLPTALQLAGAQNLDVQLAREKSTEARAAHLASLMAFYPWLAPGAGYRGHNGLIQNTDGTIIDVDKYLVTARLAHAASVTEYNKAQYVLRRASSVGGKNMRPPVKLQQTPKASLDRLLP
jgi:hypothetical protein